MADYRYIHTKIWRDEWFSELPDDGKVFWFYLLTNPSASLCGMFRLPDKFIAFDTGIEIQRIRELKEQFRKDGKIEFENDIIWVKKMRELNFSASPKIAACVLKDIEAIPASKIRDMYLSKYHINTPSIPYLNQTIPNHTEPNQTIPHQTAQEVVDEVVGRIVALYENNIGAITGIIRDDLVDTLNEFSAEWVEEAIKETKRNNGRSMKYMRAILENWKLNGFKVDNRKNGNGHKTSGNAGADYLDKRIKELENAEH